MSPIQLSRVWGAHCRRAVVGLSLIRPRRPDLFGGIEKKQRNQFGVRTFTVGGAPTVLARLVFPHSGCCHPHGRRVALPRPHTAGLFLINPVIARRGTRP
jgi:hypothetical protein